ncbi:MAG: Sec-independent protein translocase subunit TatB [Epsilonproteobacteria bacterium]|nr:Sec-independent protein translocase subunit TatB [Campylobacterota bacterium]
MFGMGFSEILIILVIGIIFLGPEKLPVAMVKVAKFFNALKKTVNEAKDSIDQELKIQELKAEAMEYKKKLEESTGSIKNSIYTDEFEKIRESTSDAAKTLNESIENIAKPLKNETKIKNDTKEQSEKKQIKADEKKPKDEDV